MKHLVLIIKELYPGRFFHLKEVYEPDEVMNCYVEYHMWIEDVCSETFTCFKELEDFVYSLYKKSALDEASKIIKGKKKRKTRYE